MAIRRQSSLYWQLRTRYGLAEFAVTRLWFQGRHALRARVAKTSLLSQVVVAVAPAVLLSVGSVALLLWLDGSLGRTILHNVEVLLTNFAPEWVKKALHDFGRFASTSLSPVYPRSDAVYSSLLVTGAQVTGAFLGLYFTAISVVASTAYSNVPTDLRATLLEDRVGNLYLSLVSYAGASCLTALGFLALGYSFGPASIIYFSLLTALAVVGFVRLGKGVFEFFSPRRVTNALARGLVRSVKGASALDRLAGDRSIQAHYQKQAAQKLDAWADIATVAMQEKWNATALEDIGASTIRVLRWYSSARRRIPDNSLWFERRLEHPSYLTADGTRLDMARRTGSMMPSSEPDLFWVEKRLRRVLQSILRALLRYGHLEACLHLLANFNSWIGDSAQELSQERLLLGFRMSDSLSEATDPVSSPEVTDTTDRVYRIAVLDGFVQTLPEAVASLNQMLRALDSDSFLNAAYAATHADTVPDAFSPRVRANIQFFRDAHRFEKKVEGEADTPAWFVHHHVARLLLVDIKSTIELLLERAETWLPRRVDALRQRSEPEAAALVVSRGVETVFKLEGTIYQASQLGSHLSAKRMAAAGSEWPDFDIPSLSKRLTALQRSLVEQLVPLMPELPVTPPTGELPDVFGFAHTTLCEATFEAVATEDDALFRLVYPALCLSTLVAHDRISAELTESPIESTILFAADVLLDLLDISGYAYLMTFALGKDTWTVVTTSWERLLGQHPDAARLVGLIAMEEEYHAGKLTITPRSLIRSQWQTRVAEVLEERGFMPGGLITRGKPQVIPIDPTAASYVGTMRLTSDARDLMLSEFILRRPEAAGVQPPRGVVDLREAVERKVANRSSGRIEGAGRF